MKVKVKKILEKIEKNEKRPYPIVKYTVDLNGKEKTIKSFFDIEEGEEIDIKIKEQIKNGVKELIGYKNRKDNYSFTSQLELLKLKERLLEKIIEVTQEEDKIKSLFVFSLSLLFNNTIEENKEGKQSSSGKITKEQLEIIQQYIGNDIIKLRKLLDWIEEHWGVNNFGKLTYDQAEILIERIKRK